MVFIRGFLILWWILFSFSVITAGEPFRADFDVDGDVDFADFIDFAGQFGQNTGESSLLRWGNRINLFTGGAWTLQSIETSEVGASPTISDSLKGVLHASVINANTFIFSWQMKNLESGESEQHWWRIQGLGEIDLHADLTGILSVTSQYSGETFQVTYTIDREIGASLVVLETLRVLWGVGTTTRTFVWRRSISPYTPGSVGGI